MDLKRATSWTRRSWFFSLQITWLLCTTAQGCYNLGHDAIMDWYWFGQTCQIKDKYTGKCYPDVLWATYWFWTFRVVSWQGCSMLSSRLIIPYRMTRNWQYPDNPNKYKAQGSHSSYRFFYGEVTVDVEFPAEAESMVKPPDPEIIRIHAAFARVLSPSGAIDYFDKVEWSAKQLGGLSTDGTSDLGLLLTGRLAHWACHM